jgi:hypothetical protein
MRSWASWPRMPMVPLMCSSPGLRAAISFGSAFSAATTGAPAAVASAMV